MLPARYGVTGHYLALRCCERLGLRPFEGRTWDALSPGERAVLAAYERIRWEEEARVHQVRPDAV